MNLPDLLTYRKLFEDEGVIYPLSASPPAAKGLLAQLPKTAETSWPLNAETNPSIYSKAVQWPKITIVTPSYNQAAYLEKTIRSVLLQNYPNLEYIIIDGGSTDDSPAIIEKYSPWLSYRQSRPDRGQSHAINMGFSLASGQIYAWINSDDYYLPGVFHLVATAFLANKKPAFVYGYGQDLDESGNMNTTTVPPFTDYFIKIPTLVQPSCFWLAAIHQPVWEEMHCALDYELWLRLVKGNKRTRLKVPLSVAHVHQSAKTSDPAMKAKWHEDHLKMWADDAHGPVPEWNRVVFFNRIRMKIFRLLKLV
ncbi:glycosyltransferase family 2 protein [Mucilaginibacter pedocola]|uniref:Glycosyltransferase 2-like domain-containing protein n=1 Tax=Mucilaginibacter pedocola TaxID=1792845 RepID=A0A1S9PAS3_9SPHI|nr:glycosyltransferase family 2 protein [Mucilaginibacter pedocola]OOQ58074.1 hypothetical protein BC343_10470 [Mucilaginibacter pedocola]